MQDDSASMIPHRDADSLLSYYADTSIASSKRSIVFEFDRELFTTRIYERWIRGSVNKTLREQQGDIRSFKAIKRSKDIDRVVEKDARRLSRECTVLVLGSESRSELVEQMKIHCFSYGYSHGFSDDELRNYRPAIFRSVVNSAKAVVGAMEYFGIVPVTLANRKYVDFIAEYILDPDPALPLGQKFGDSLSALWTDPCIEQLMERQNEFYLMDSAEYFFQEIRRISSPEYLPNETDVLRARTKTSSISETRFQWSQFCIKMFDVGDQRSERNKWIHLFENVCAILFVVDLDTYDQVVFEEPSQNKLMESLILFDSFVNSRWFMRSSIILCLNRVDVFKQKLGMSPLQRYFPDYSGGNDVNRAAKYILWRFNQINRAHLKIYPYLTQSTDRSNVRQVFAALKEIILLDALKKMWRALSSRTSTLSNTSRAW
ncbi:related to G protein alpha subunit GNA-3 [Phialocephala subalpina]|uniref:Related to G protein alpha subunit GNA-3 n=1 Tax=Phialocephala subalpina TaxID=576137 RepID=A0A1L7XTP4_9HELO|nr:related to G protein alpha subunit GNA-3 [Phialocephala subalpina]